MSLVDNEKSGSESECSDVMRLRQEVLAIAHALPHTEQRHSYQVVSIC